MQRKSPGERKKELGEQKNGDATEVAPVTGEKKSEKKNMTKGHGGKMATTKRAKQRE